MGSKPPADHRMGLVFDTVVLCALPFEYQPPAGSFGRARILRCPIDDGVLKPDELRRALEAGRIVGALIGRRKRTLSTCYMGLNRSGLIAGLALLCQGVPADKAIQMIRAARGPSALSNPHFVKILKEHDGKMRPAASYNVERRP